MKRDRLALSSDATAQSAALDALGTGNAVDALVAGVLAAATAHASVLFGPFQALVGGAGSGLHAIDGRLRQPGRGAPRPRGFLPGDAIPLASRVAVPLLPHALSSLASTYGTRTFGALAAAAAAGCEKGSPRQTFMKLLGSRGPAGMLERRVAGALEDVAGRMEGGLLTKDDLEAAVPTITPLQVRRGKSFVVGTPWDDDAPLDGAIHLLLTADRFGGFAAATFLVAASGVEVADLGIVAPLAAAPVMRGTTRLAVGTPLPSPAPIRVWGETSLDGAFGAMVPDALARVEKIAREPLGPPVTSEGDGVLGMMLHRQDGRVTGRTVRI